MKVEVMVSDAKCNALRDKLKHLVDTEPKVTKPEGLDDTTILVYDIVVDDGQFARKAMMFGASSVSKTIV